MNELFPFPDETRPEPPFRIHAAATISSGILRLSYELRGDLGDIDWPELAAAPCRRDELWKQTCFESFFLDCGGIRYWEVNLSPSGDWNLYRFTGYRQGMAPENGSAPADFAVGSSPGALTLKASMPVAALHPRFPLRLGLTAVIGERSGRRTHWALRHCGERPDFHRPESFLVELGG